MRYQLFNAAGFMFLFPLLFGVSLNSPVVAASFDCEMSSSVLDRTICTDAELSAADEEMSRLFGRVQTATMPDKKKLQLKEQRAWLQKRTASCAGTDVSCLLDVYRARINALRDLDDNIVEFKLSEPNAFQGVRGRCDFKDLSFPADLAIYAAGQYGGRTLDVQIDQSGHQATQFDVIVNSPKKPVALILSSYEPSIWNIGWTEGTKILAVVATGYHRQAVAGLPGTTPILISTNDSGSACGWSYTNYKTLQDVNPFSIKTYGKQVDMVHFAMNGKVTVGTPEFGKARLLTSRNISPESFIDKTRPLAGPAGIRDAVAKGIIRPATMTDADAWAAHQEKSLPKGAIPPVAGVDSRRSLRGPYGSGVYVILKPFKLPAGLYGAHAVKLYLPEKVPYPEGNLGHSVVYDFNTIKCNGAVCRDD